MTFSDKLKIKFYFILSGSDFLYGNIFIVIKFLFVFVSYEMFILP